MTTKSLFLLFLLVFPLRLSAEVKTLEKPLRERCRLELSGSYIKKYDAYDLAYSRVESLKRKIKQAELKKQAKKSDFNSYHKKASGAEFDKDSQAKAKQISAEIQSIDQYIAGIKAMQPEASKNLEEQKTIFQKFSDIIEPLVDVKNRNRPVQQPYPERIDFKYQCQKFEDYCPLPGKVAKKLSVVVMQYRDELKYCEAYLGLSRIQLPRP